MTTSAASDEALAPRAPMAMPTLAAASAGASLMPSPTMMVGLQPLLDRHRIDLVGGNPVGEHGIEIQRRADGFRGIGAVAGHHDDPRHPGRSQGLHGARRLAPQFIAKQQGADRAAVHGDEHAQGRPPRRAPQRTHRPVLRLARAVHQLMRADPDRAAVDLSLQARSQRLAHQGRNRELKALAQGRLDDGGGDDVMGRLLQ